MAASFSSRRPKTAVCLGLLVRSRRLSKALDVLEPGCVTNAQGHLCAIAALAKKGKTSEQVGEAAAEELLEALAHGGCVDEWLQDQLVIFMALADGRSAVTCGEISLHTRTATKVCEMLTTAKFDVRQLPTGVWQISCEGAGIKAGN